jgi:hypothetical protein
LPIADCRLPIEGIDDWGIVDWIGGLTIVDWIRRLSIELTIGNAFLKRKGRQREAPPAQ